VAGLIFLGLCLWPGAVVSGWTSQQLALIEAASFSMKRHLGSFLALLFATALVLACAVSCEVYGVIVGGTNVETLIRVQRDVRNLLAAATIWLIIGIVGIGALSHLAAMSRVPDFRTAINAMGAAATAFSGAFYSTLLAAIFGPAEFLLRSAGRQLAARHAGPSTAEDAWLQGQGFDFSLSKSLLKVFAILSPLLAGLTQNIVDIGAASP